MPKNPIVFGDERDNALVLLREAIELYQPYAELIPYADLAQVALSATTSSEALESSAVSLDRQIGFVAIVNR